MTAADVERGRGLLAAADAVLITAGAGMGVDSGLPDFRGAEGFWRAYPPFAKLGLRFEELAQPHWFRRDPELAWGFYGGRLNQYRKTTPHDGFGRLLAFARSRPRGSFVYTSNIDNQFQQAGFDPDAIVECHGALEVLQCTAARAGCYKNLWPAPADPIAVNPTTLRASPPLPTCPTCGALARPNVLMFGDDAWVSDRSGDQFHRLGAWLRRLRDDRANVVVIEAGAGTAIPTVREMSENCCRGLGGSLIRINPREAEVTADLAGRSVSLPAGAGEALAALLP